MRENKEDLTGFLKIDNEAYYFVFENYELIIFSHIGVGIDCPDELVNSDNILQDKNCIHGYLPTSGQKILFFIGDTPCNNQLIAPSSKTYKVYSYVMYKYKDDVWPISTLEFRSNEINWFYYSNSGIEYKYSNDLKSIGIDISRDEEITEKFSFHADTEKINCTLGAGTRFSPRELSPISSYSYLSLSFEPTTNYEIICKLYNVVKLFFQFICYRKNIQFEPLELIAINSKGKKQRIATMYISEDTQIEKDVKIIQKTLPYQCIKQHVGKLFEMIFNNQIHFSNIPRDKKHERTLNYERFLSTVSAFEWTYRFMYENELTKVSDERIGVRKDILLKLNELDAEKSYKKSQRDEFKSYKRALEKSVEKPTISLSNQLINALNETHLILELFIKQIYSYNDKQDFSISTIAKNIEEQRNIFAHGNMDKEYNTDAFLDIMIVEWLIYAMILKHIGFSDEECQKIINIIFNRNFSM